MDFWDAEEGERDTGYDEDGDDWKRGMVELSRCSFLMLSVFYYPIIVDT